MIAFFPMILQQQLQLQLQLQLLLLLLLPKTIYGAVGYNPIVQCVDLPARDINGNNIERNESHTTTTTTAAAVVVNQTVCFTSSFETPSPGTIVLENGTEITEYFGPFGFMYEFWKEAYEGINTEEISPWEDDRRNSTYRAEPGTVSIRWYDDDQQEACELMVDGVNCTDCMVCSTNTNTTTTDMNGGGVVQVSADCTTATPNGRLLNCEDVEPVLFPIVAASTDAGADADADVAADADESITEDDLDTSHAGLFHNCVSCLQTVLFAIATGLIFSFYSI